MFACIQNTFTKQTEPVNPNDFIFSIHFMETRKHNDAGVKRQSSWRNKGGEEKIKEGCLNGTKGDRRIKLSVLKDEFKMREK